MNDSKVREVIWQIKHTVENYPAGRRRDWDLDKLDGDLDFIYECAEKLEELTKEGE